MVVLFVNAIFSMYPLYGTDNCCKIITNVQQSASLSC